MNEISPIDQLNVRLQAASSHLERCKEGRILTVALSFCAIALIVINALGMSYHLTPLTLGVMNSSFFVIGLPLGLKLSKICNTNVNVRLNAIVICILFITFLLANGFAIAGCLSSLILGGITICSPLLVFLFISPLLLFKHLNAQIFPLEQTIVCLKEEKAKKICENISENVKNHLFSLWLFCETYHDKQDDFYKTTSTGLREAKHHFIDTYGIEVWRLLMLEYDSKYPSFRGRP